mmetsp:Transcript_125172/g.216932  ORF Transcript_125172/g.216932 Transcript_125172/m.216932 type:complete len:85 (+) Transcript_125172:1178-1432(+)
MASQRPQLTRTQRKDKRLQPLTPTQSSKSLSPKVSNRISAEVELQLLKGRSPLQALRQDLASVGTNVIGCQVQNQGAERGRKGQ